MSYNEGQHINGYTSNHNNRTCAQFSSNTFSSNFFPSNLIRLGSVKIGGNGLDDNRLDENRLDQNELNEKYVYSIEWGGTDDLYTKPIINQHKRIIRIICNCSRLDHTTPLFCGLKLLRFQDIFKFSMKNKFPYQRKCLHNVNTQSNDLAATLFHRLDTHREIFSKSY